MLGHKLFTVALAGSVETINHFLLNTAVDINRRQLSALTLAFENDHSIAVVLGVMLTEDTRTANAALMLTAWAGATDTSSDTGKFWLQRQRA